MSSSTRLQTSGRPTAISRQVSLAALAPRERTRSFVVGWTGSGKSTLAAQLLEEYHRLHARHTVIVLDPKNRFIPVEREEHDTLLFPEGAKERNFGRRDGVAILGSLLTRPRLPAADERESCYVVHDTGLINGLCSWLYEHSTVKRPALLYADESFDLVSRAFHDPFRRLIQQGREIGVGSLVINQRPANIDQTWISESQQLYVGRLIKPEDRKRMIDASSVLAAHPILSHPIPKFQWLYLDQENERMQRFRLILPGSKER